MLPKQDKSVILFDTAEKLAAQLTVEFVVKVDPEPLNRFANMVLSSNKLFNLTAHKDLPSVFTSLFYESLVPYRKEDFSPNCSVVDVGSGSGVPGLLLKLIFPQVKLTTVESNSKKCGFINTVISELSLRDVSVVCARAEELANDSRESFDISTARAVAALPALLELLAPLTKVGGKIICPKSRKYWEEIEQADRAIKALGLQDPVVRSFKSKTGVEHNVAVFAKTKPTPAEFPRKWSQILAKPL